MKKITGVVLIFMLFIACKQTIKQDDITKINGYWEITKVTFDKGEDKDYRMNETYDYFDIKDNKGIRKKVKPQLNGTYLVNDTYENVIVRYSDEGVFLDYNTPYMKWSEEIVKLSDEELVLINKEKTEYHYKKTEAINLLGDGKTIK